MPRALWWGRLTRLIVAVERFRRPFGRRENPGHLLRRVSQLDLSLVVTTRNRAHRLPATLRWLSEIRSERLWELVLVDNGSTDRTAALLEDFAASAPMPVRTVSEPERGLGRALNAGVRAARGEIVATTDDDCYPRPDYVEAVVSVFERHDVGYIGGRVLLYDDRDARVSVFEGQVPHLLPAGFFPYPGFIGGGNLAFQRAVFDDIGGFDPELGAGTSFPCEDIEFCARASTAGWHGGYFPGPTVYHHHRRRPGRDEERVGRAYARARGAYYAKVLVDHPTLRIPCLRWWYWSLSSTQLSYTLREVVWAIRYLSHRALSRAPRRPERE